MRLSTEQLKRECEDRMLRACSARMGEIIAEAYKDYNAGEVFSPYSVITNALGMLKVELPNLNWSDTTFKLPVTDFCIRMFNTGNVTEYSYGMYLACIVTLRENDLIDSQDELGLLLISLDIERKCKHNE